MRRRGLQLLIVGYIVLFILFIRMMLPERKPYTFDIEIPTKHAFNCSNIHDISLYRKWGHGHTKQTYLGYYEGHTVIVKSVSKDALDIKTCVKTHLSQHKTLNIEEPYEKTLWRCITLPQMKLLKEILYMEQLYHPNIIPLLGYCVKNEVPGTYYMPVTQHGAVAVYKYGEEISVPKVRLKNVYKQLMIMIELADVMHYLQYSPLGSLLFPDFKISHFLLLDDHAMIIDFDDVNDLEPKCGEDILIAANPNDTEKQSAAKKESKLANDECRYGIKCSNNVCTGVNALHNLKQTSEFFIKPIITSLVSKSRYFCAEFDKIHSQILSYLSEIRYSMKPDQLSPPTAGVLRDELKTLQECLLFEYSGKTLPPTVKERSKQENMPIY